MAEGQNNSEQDVPKTEMETTTLGGSPLPDSEQRLMRRRRILKGMAAGIPAIVTLQSGAALAATSVSTCVKDGPGTYADLGNVRCFASDPTTNSYLFLADNDPVWTGSNGPGNTATPYCAVYVQEDGTVATANAGGAGNFGGLSATGGPNTDYYAIKRSCWTTFH